MSVSRTPVSIYPQVVKLCRQINPQVAPTFMTVISERACKPNDCFDCVRHKVERDGGRIRFGWAIWEWPRVLIEAEHHAVYESPDGRLIDITPSSLPDVRRRLFLPDDTAIYDFANEGVRRGNRRVALVDDSLVQDFFAVAAEEEEILNGIPGVGEVSIDFETDRRLSQVRATSRSHSMKPRRPTPVQSPSSGCWESPTIKSCRRSHGRRLTDQGAQFSV